MTRNLVLAQIGCGYWGPNLLRNFSALPGCVVKYVVDPSAQRRAFVSANFPSSRALEKHEAVLEDRDVDGVIIATPAGSHFALAKEVIDAGKHVFVEKPLATKVAEVDEISKRAAARNVVVMVGHTFVYNPAVRYIKKLIDSGELGDLRYIYSQRLNLGRIRSDIDALWNFAPHDISIIQYLAWQPGANFHWPPRDGLHAGWHRRRCFPESRVSRKDYRKRSRQLVRSAEGAEDDYCRLE